uniref:TIMELESS-interacting protein n=1 Tax=Steinernema glaseri TaxID=37863 RepID=A0A1I8A084_9BILA
MEADEDQEFANFFGNVGDQADESDDDRDNPDGTSSVTCLYLNFSSDVPTDADVLSRIMKKSDKDGGKIPGTSTRKRAVIPKLGPNELIGKRGIASLYRDFENYKVNPKMDEYENLNMIMKKIEHWGHLLYPRLHFDDLTNKLDSVGQKAVVKLHMRHLRNDTGPYDPENAMYIYGDDLRKSKEPEDNTKSWDISEPSTSGTNGDIGGRKVAVECTPQKEPTSPRLQSSWLSRFVDEQEEPEHEQEQMIDEDEALNMMLGNDC